MADIRILRCNKCKNVVMVLNSGTCIPQCCGEEMQELKANTSDGAMEKHVPDVTVEGDTLKVQVGSTEHPMFEEHYIQWIYLQTETDGQIKYLKPGEAPRAEFVLNGRKPVAVYEYCNLHGLWKKEL